MIILRLIRRTVIVVVVPLVAPASRRCISSCDGCCFGGEISHNNRMYRQHLAIVAPFSVREGLSLW